MPSLLYLGPLCTRRFWHGGRHFGTHGGGYIKSPTVVSALSLLDGRRGHERLLEGGGRLRPRPERATVDEEEGDAGDAPPGRRLCLAPRRLLAGLGDAIQCT